MFNGSCDRLLVDMVFLGITVTSTLVGVFFNALLPTIDVCIIIHFFWIGSSTFCRSSALVGLLSGSWVSFLLGTLN